jgi:hypothetical protein
VIEPNEAKGLDAKKTRKVNRLVAAVLAAFVVVLIVLFLIFTHHTALIEHH